MTVNRASTGLYCCSYSDPGFPVGDLKGLPMKVTITPGWVRDSVCSGLCPSRTEIVSWSVLLGQWARREGDGETAASGAGPTAPVSRRHSRTASGIQRTLPPAQPQEESPDSRNRSTGYTAAGVIDRSFTIWWLLCSWKWRLKLRLSLENWNLWKRISWGFYNWKADRCRHRLDTGGGGWMVNWRVSY